MDLSALEFLFCNIEIIYYFCKNKLLNDMNQRLEQLMKAERLTSAKFAEILSVQPSSISHLLSGRNKPNFDFIAKLLLMFPTLNPRWIINGQSPMYIDQNDEPNNSELPLNYNVDRADIVDSKSPNIVNQLPQHQNIQSVNSVNQNRELQFAEKQNSNTIADNQVEAPRKVEFRDESKSSSTTSSVQDTPSDARSVQRVLLLYNDHSFEFFDTLTK